MRVQHNQPHLALPFGAAMPHAALVRSPGPLDHRAAGRGTLLAAGVALVSMCSVQLGAGIAAGAFDEVAPASIVMLRQAGAALVLIAWRRPRPWRWPVSERRFALAYGVVFAGMNLTFYESVRRLPLGIAVTIELLGPIGVAVAQSRRLREIGAVLLAGAGVLLLAEGGGRLDPLGILFAGIAACGWAAYILLSRRAGASGSGLDRLAVALLVACVLSAPFGLRAGRVLVRPHILLIGAAVAVLSALVPFSLDQRVLRTLPSRVFGVLQCLSPAIAGFSGAITLGERVSGGQALGMAMVTAAAVVTVASGARSRTRPVRARPVHTRSAAEASTFGADPNATVPDRHSWRRG